MGQGVARGRGADSGGIVGLANLVTEHGGALDYDLMTMTIYTIDDVGGRLPVGSLAHFVRHLPPESATMRELYPDEQEKILWSKGYATAQLVAALIDELRSFEYMYAKRNSRGGVRKPVPFETPWTKPTKRVQHFGSDPIRIADFDEWFDS